MVTKRKSVKVEVPAARGWARTKGGLVKAMFTISPAQFEALRQAAFKRAQETGAMKPDASAVLREVLDAWLAKSPHREP